MRPNPKFFSLVPSLAYARFRAFAFLSRLRKESVALAVRPKAFMAYLGDLLSSPRNQRTHLLMRYITCFFDLFQIG
jgi:hypothetical protein